MKPNEIKRRLKQLTNTDWQIISISMNGVDECYYSSAGGQMIQCHLVESYIKVQEKNNTDITSRNQKINNAEKAIKNNSMK